MKRSIALLVSVIFSTIYSAFLLFTFGGAIINAGGMDFVNAVGAYFEFAFKLIGADSAALNFLYAVVVLLCVHIGVFVIGCLLGWISFITRKSGLAKFTAVLYLIGSICFPIYIFVGLPITIVGFVGGGKQKKLNNQQN